MPENPLAAAQHFPCVARLRAPRYVGFMDETDDAVERRLLADAVAAADATPPDADTPQATVRAQLLAVRARLRARLGRDEAP